MLEALRYQLIRGIRTLELQRHRETYLKPIPRSRNRAEDKSERNATSKPVLPLVTFAFKAG
jgi:hypothetical protein